jgi:uncharacterized protein YcfJ
MNKQLLVVVVGSMAVTAAALIGCSPAGTQSANAGHEECTNEVVTLTRKPKDKDQIAGTAVGAVIGGVLGNQIGQGDGKTLATVGGAVAGGYTGNKIQKKAQEENTYQETKRTCRMVYN